MQISMEIESNQKISKRFHVVIIDSMLPFNPLTTNVSDDTETSQLTCIASSCKFIVSIRLGTLVVNG